MLELHKRTLIIVIIATSLTFGGLCYSATTKSTAGLPNFALVDPGLYRGAAPTPQGLGQLKKMGVKTVVDLRISPKRVKAERSEVQKLGMLFVNLPMGSDPPTSRQKAAFLSIVSTAAQQPVFVHCEYGADRTGAMIGLHRRLDDHWTYARTYAEMRHFGFKPYYTKLAAVVKNAPLK